MPKKPTLEAAIVSILLLSGLWIALFFLRSQWYHPWCAVTPTPCTLSSVNSFDQFAFQFGSITADFLSNILQNLVGAFILILPWVLLKDRFKLALKITLFLLILTLSNGVLLEIVRAFVQRPRPLVFKDPMGDGAQISHYTSFYSGHTSFVTLAALGTYLWIKELIPENQKAKRYAMIGVLIIPVMMALLRVWGGRHYPTDTLGGMTFATILTLLLFSSFKKKGLAS